MKLRNIGIIAHVDAGKTTTTERILHTVGYINHVGSVDAGTTIADFLPQERKRGITIQSCSIPILYKEHKINLIDTPGHVDFQFQVEKSLRVLDGCVVILDGVSGVEAQTVKVWKQANIYKKSRIVFVNKMDRAEASFYESVKSMEKLKGWGTPLICQLPIYTSRVGINSVRNKRGDGIFRGVVDLVYFKQITVNGDGGLETSTIPDEMVKDVTKAREMLVEKLADLDNEMLDLAITEEDYSKIDGRDISHSLRKVTLAGTAVPVLLGSGFKNIGVPQLLDSIIDYLPSPVDVGSCDSSKELSALVFKVTKDLTRGLLTFVRVYDGIIQPKVALKIGNTIEKAVKVYEIFANDYKQIDSIQSGNIGVIQGLKNAKTGDTIRTGDTQILEPIFIPQPVFFRQLEPDSMKDEKLLKECLLELERDDPSLHVSFEEDEIFLAGLGELHLEIAKDRLENMNCKFSMGPISISYRERIHGNTTEFVKFSRVLGDKTVECGLELNITVEDDVDTEILINVSEREVYQDEKFQNNHNVILNNLV